MLKKNFLMSPGPSKIPESILLEMAQPIFHHRTPQYKKIFKSVTKKLKQLFRTQNDVFVYASSGTGALEASITSFLSPDDNVITIDSGKFGERFSLICKAFGVKPNIIETKWGEAVSVDSVKKLLEENPSIKAVYATLCETSTATLTNIKEIAAIVKKTNAIFVVDAISGLGADMLETDEWGIDVVVGGSQKALMLPPGLAFMSVSNKAFLLAESSTIPSFYFDLTKYKKSLTENDVPWTPATLLIVGLEKALTMILDEGMENVWIRHARLANATRLAIKALGLELLSSSPSNAVTAVKLPSTVSGKKFIELTRDTLGVTFAGGQGGYSGTLFRIGHMGYCNQYDMVTALASIEEGLDLCGFEFIKGNAVKKFQEVWLS